MPRLACREKRQHDGGAPPWARRAAHPRNAQLSGIGRRSRPDIRRPVAVRRSHPGSHSRLGRPDIAALAVHRSRLGHPGSRSHLGRPGHSPLAAVTLIVGLLHRAAGARLGARVTAVHLLAAGTGALQAAVDVADIPNTAIHARERRLHSAALGVAAHRGKRIAPHADIGAGAQVGALRHALRLRRRHPAAASDQQSGKRARPDLHRGSSRSIDHPERQKLGIYSRDAHFFSLGCRMDRGSTAPYLPGVTRRRGSNAMQTKQFGIGQPVRRVEDRRFLTGQRPLSRRHRRGRGRPMRSCCARRMRMPASARSTPAAAPPRPGVVAVFTGEDLGARRHRHDPLRQRGHQPRRVADRRCRRARPSRATGCAMSATRSRSSSPRPPPQARDAAELIEVDYEPLPAVDRDRARRSIPASRWYGTRCPAICASTGRSATEAAVERGVGTAQRIACR